MKALYDGTRAERCLVYRVADRTIMVKALDTASATLVEKIFAEWYLVPETGGGSEVPDCTIRFRSSTEAPEIPSGYSRFEIADGGVCHSNGGSSYLEIEGSLVALSPPGMTEVDVWLRRLSEDDLPTMIRVISYAVSSALRRCGLFELHSAAVVEPRSGDGWLIIGPSGSGKSTLTVQLSADGWPYLSDDVLVFGDGRDGIEAWPLRRCFAVTEQTFSAIPFLKARVSSSGFAGDKARFSPYDVFASEFKESCIPRTLIFSLVTGDENSRVSALTPGETMARLIQMNPWSCYDKSTAGQHLAALSRLVKQSKGFQLFAGRDLLVPGNPSRFLRSVVRN
jgi:hypothetical protein